MKLHILFFASLLLFNSLCYCAWPVDGHDSQGSNRAILLRQESYSFDTENGTISASSTDPSFTDMHVIGETGTSVLVLLDHKNRNLRFLNSISLESFANWPDFAFPISWSEVKWLGASSNGSSVFLSAVVDGCWTAYGISSYHQEAHKIVWSLPLPCSNVTDRASMIYNTLTNTIETLVKWDANYTKYVRVDEDGRVLLEKTILLGEVYYDESIPAIRVDGHFKRLIVREHIGWSNTDQGTAIDIKTGEVLWRKPIVVPFKITESCMVVSDNGTAVFAFKNGKIEGFLIAVDANGTMLWKNETTRACPLALTNDPKVFLAGGRVTSLETGIMIRDLHADGIEQVVMGNHVMDMSANGNFAWINLSNGTSLALELAWPILAVAQFLPLDDGSIIAAVEIHGGYNVTRFLPSDAPPYKFHWWLWLLIALGCLIGIIILISICYMCYKTEQDPALIPHDHPPHGYNSV